VAHRVLVVAGDGEQGELAPVRRELEHPAARRARGRERLREERVRRRPAGQRRGQGGGGELLQALRPGRHVLGLGPGRALRGEQPLALALGRPVGGDVGEEDGDPAVLRPVDAERVHVVPAAEHLGGASEADRLPRARHPAAELEPVCLGVGGQLPEAPPHGVREPGLLQEGRVGLDEPAVGGPARAVDEHLEDAEPRVDRLEERAVPRLARAQRGFGTHALGDVAPEDRGAALVGRVGVDLEVPVVALAHVVLREVLLDPLGHHPAVRPPRVAVDRGREDLPVGAAEHLAARLAQRVLGGGVDVRDAELAVERDVRVAHALEDPRRAHLRPRGGLLGADPLGDVFGLVQHRAHGAALAAHRRVERVPVPHLPRAVGAPQVVALARHPLRRAGPDGRLQRGAQARQPALLGRPAAARVVAGGRPGRRVRVGERLGQGAPDQGVTRSPGGRQERVARGEEREVRRVGGEHRRRPRQRREDGEQAEVRQVRRRAVVPHGLRRRVCHACPPAGRPGGRLPGPPGSGGPATGPAGAVDCRGTAAVGSACAPSTTATWGAACGPGGAKASERAGMSSGGGGRRRVTPGAARRRVAVAGRVCDFRARPTRALLARVREATSPGPVHAGVTRRPREQRRAVARQRRVHRELGLVDLRRAGSVGARSASPEGVLAAGYGPAMRASALPSRTT
jgi:hypothetical protein